MTEEEELVIKLEWDEFLNFLPSHIEEGELVPVNLITDEEMENPRFEDKFCGIRFGRDVWIPTYRKGMIPDIALVQTNRNYNQAEHTILVNLIEDEDEVVAEHVLITTKVDNHRELADYFFDNYDSFREDEVKLIEYWLVVESDLYKEDEYPLSLAALHGAVLREDGFVDVMIRIYQNCDGVEQDVRHEFVRNNLFREWVKLVYDDNSDQRLS